MHHQALEHVDFLGAPEAARKTFALQWSVPLGSARGTHERDGLSPLHAELAQRGGGGRDAKAFAYALDDLGVRRSIRLGTHFLHIDALGLPEALLPALSLCADVIREPNITAEHLKSAKLLVNQGRRSIEDDPGALARDHLRRLHAPAPFDRSAYGCEEVVEAADPKLMLQDWADWSGCQGGRVVVAGQFDSEQVVEHLQGECQRMSWTNRTLDPLHPESPLEPEQKFVERPLAQVHLVWAWSAPTLHDSHRATWQVLSRILGASGSGRLFHEVRQKRSLCYAVGGGWAPSDDFGRFMVSAGTTPDRASETVKVVEEVMRGVLEDRPSEEEISRAKEGVLSALTLRRESTAARAGALGNHFTTFGEVWDPKKEVQAIAEVDQDAMDAALSAWTLKTPWAVALGATNPFSDAPT